MDGVNTKHLEELTVQLSQDDAAHSMSDNNITNIDIIIAHGVNGVVLTQLNRELLQMLGIHPIHLLRICSEIPKLLNGLKRFPDTNNPNK